MSINRGCSVEGPLPGISRPGISWIPRQVPCHPAQRCGAQKSASCGYCLCQYSWIPHQVRNDVKHRVKARYDVEHRIKCGMTGSGPRTAMRGPEKRLLWVLPLPIFPGFRIKCGMTGSIAVRSEKDDAKRAKRRRKNPPPFLRPYVKLPHSLITTTRLLGRSGI